MHCTLLRHAFVTHVAIDALIIALSTAGTVGKAVVAPIGLLTDLWRGLLNRPEVLSQLPNIGMLRE